MHFQLFFPNETANPGRCLVAAGLPDFVDGAIGCQTVVEGRSGLLVGWGPSVGYVPARQRWINAGPYLVGFWTDSVCSPSELSRSARFTSFRITLADGQDWSVPVASELPANVRLVDGHWSKVRKPQFDAFWTASEIWFRRFMLFDLDDERMLAESGLTPESFLAEWADFCTFALRQNYRLTPLIASELGLFDTDSMLRVTMAAVDGMAVREVMEELSKEGEREDVGLVKKNDGQATQG